MKSVPRLHGVYGKWISAKREIWGNGKWLGETEADRVESVPVPLSLLQIPRKLPWDRNRASHVKHNHTRVELPIHVDIPISTLNKRTINRLNFIRLLTAHSVHTVWKFVYWLVIQLDTDPGSKSCVWTNRNDKQCKKDCHVYCNNKDILHTEVGVCVSQYAILRQLHGLCSCRSRTDWTRFCHGKT
jgi:hypothetical protein